MPPPMPVRDLTRGFGPHVLAVMLLLPLVPGCVTDGLLRMARNDADLSQVEEAWRTPEGGLAVSGRMALGTFRTRSQTLHVDPEALEAAFESQGARTSLPRSAVGEAGVRADGCEPVPVVAVSPYEFDWKDDLSSLRLPKGAHQALFYQGRAPFFFHLRKARLAYLREVAEGETQVAVFELGPGRGKQPLWYLPVPVTATVEALQFGAADGPHPRHGRTRVLTLPERLRTSPRTVPRRRSRPRASASPPGLTTCCSVGLDREPGGELRLVGQLQGDFPVVALPRGRQGTLVVVPEVRGRERQSAAVAVAPGDQTAVDAAPADVGLDGVHRLVGHAHAREQRQSLDRVLGLEAHALLGQGVDTGFAPALAGLSGRGEQREVVELAGVAPDPHRVLAEQPVAALGRRRPVPGDPARQIG